MYSKYHLKYLALAIAPVLPRTSPNYKVCEPYISKLYVNKRVSAHIKIFAVIYLLEFTAIDSKYSVFE